MPLPKVLAKYLREKQLTSRAKLVAPNTAGQIFDYDNCRRDLRKLCESLQIQPVTLHELRHSCSELWMENGASIEDIRRLLNHKSAQTTSRYIHRNDLRISKIAEALLIDE